MIPIKKFALICVVLLLGNFMLVSQICEHGIPLSFTLSEGMKEHLTNAPKVYIPSVSNVQERNRIKNDPQLFETNIYGKTIDCNYNTIALSEINLFQDSIQVYTLKICSDSAFGMQFFFDDFFIPEGGKLFFFNEKETHYIGGFTSKNNRENSKFGTRPILGNTIVIEYHEPAYSAISAKLMINKIVYIFNEDFFNPQNLAGDCNKSVACLEENGFYSWENTSKSVVMILHPYILPEYYSICTGTLLNVAGGYKSIDQPYLLSAFHCAAGFDPYSNVEDWVFLFGFEDSECGVTNSNTQFFTQNNSAYGAELLTFDDWSWSQNNIISDFLLCRLMDDFNTINSNIDVSYAGWDKSGDQPYNGICFHNPQSSSKMFSYSENITTINQIFETTACPIFIPGNDFWDVYWNIGVTENGSSGSPIFNIYQQVFGFLHGGLSACTVSMHPYCDYIIGPDERSLFGKFSTSWEEGNFEDYLDPYATNLSSVETFTPNFCGNGICEPENGEVFPDCPDCPDPNWGGGGGGGGSICWLPVSEGFKINDSNDEIVLICPDYQEISLSSPDDDCLLTIGSEILESGDSHCEFSDWPSCWWTGMLWWKKCNCWHWMYFISVTECDYLLNPIGGEYSGWFNKLQNSEVLLELSVLGDINSMGVSLQQGKYYKLKLATSPWGSGWTEATEHFYILPEDGEISQNIESGNYIAEDNLTMVDGFIEVNQNVTMTAGNSITILPNSTISYGSNYLAKIDPEIPLNCAVIPTSNVTYKSHLNSLGQEASFLSDTKFSVSTENSEIQIYPNPSNGFVNICLSDKVGVVTIDVRNINGKGGFVDNWKYPDNIILDLSHYPKGIYLLTITTNSKVYTEKIILQ